MPDPIDHDARQTSAMDRDRAALAPRYVPLDLLGAGASARVWRAQDAAAVREVALKLASEAGAGPEVALRLEYELLGRLRHPGIVAALDVGLAADGRAYLALEVVPGPGLDALVPLAPAEALPRLVEALAALAHMHARGYLHGDLKPANMRLDAAGRLVLVDFGLLRRLGEGGPLQGTPLYMAPEAILGDPLDGRADLYALAAVFYHLLAGRPPFEAVEPLALLRAHLHDAPPDLARQVPGLPAELARLLEAMLAKAPQDRPASAAVALARLGHEPPGTLAVAPGFVGRDAELRALQQALARTGPAGTVVAVTAPAGQGKGALLGELRARLRLKGQEVLLASAARHGSTPYGALADLAGPLAMLARLHGATALPTAEALAGGRPGLEGPALAAAVRAAWAELVEAAAGGAKLVLLLDDWDQADEASRELAAFLARRHADALAVVAAGGAEPWAGAPGEVIALSPLGAAEAALLVAGALGGEPPTGLAEALYQATGGVPGALLGVLGALAARGELARTADGWQVAAAALAPATLAALAAATALGPVAGLEGPAATLAAGLAAARQPWPLAALGAWLGLAPAPAAAAAGELLARGLAAGDEGALAARTPALAAAIARGLGPKAMARAHAAIAAGLDPTDAARAADLAAHWLAAGRSDLAKPHAVAGARACLQASMLAEADELARFALAVATAPAERAEALELAGDLARRRGEAEAALAAYGEAEACAPGGPRARLAVDRALVLHVAGRIADAREAAGQGVARARAEDDGRELARALTTVARLAQLQGDMADAVAAAEEALGAARAAGDERLEAEALGLWALVAPAQGGDRALAAERLARALALCERRGDPLELGDMLGLVGNARLAEGRYAEAIACFTRNVALARNVGAPPAETATAAFNLAQCRLEAGQLDQALAAWEPAAALARDHGMGFLAAYGLALRARIEAAAGRVAAALATADEAVAEGGRQGEYLAALAHGARAEARLAAGDATGALADVLAGQALAEGAGVTEFAAWHEAVACEARLAAGKRAAAAHGCARLRARAAGAPAVAARAAVLAARLALDDGEPAEALAALALARAAAADAGQAGLAVEADLIEGALAAAAGDAVAAAHAYRRAHEAARRLGMPARVLAAARGLARWAPGEGTRADLDVATAWLERTAAALAPEARAALRAAWAPAGPGALAPALAALTLGEALERLAAPRPTGAVDDTAAIVLEFGRLVTHGGRYEEVLERVIERSLAVTHAERAMLVLVDAAGGLAGLLVRSTDDQDPAGLAGFSHTFVRAALAERRPVWVADARSDERFAAAASVNALELRSVLAAPLIADDEVIGAIYVDRRSVVQGFGPRELAIVEGLAGFAARAIASARRIEAAEADAAPGRAALALAWALPQAATRAERERAVLDHALALAGADWGWLLEAGIPGAPRAGVGVPAGEVPDGHVLAEAGRDAVAREAVTAARPHFALAVALAPADDDGLVLYLARPREAGPFPPARAAALGAFARLAEAHLAAAARLQRAEDRVAMLEAALVAAGSHVDDLDLDALTRLPGPRPLAARLAREVEAAAAGGHALAVLVLEVARLGALNERFGRAAGDAVLAGVAEELVRASRREDAVARLGGAAFAVLMPRTSEADARRLAGRLEARLAGLALDDGAADDAGWPVAVALAVAAWRAPEPPEELLARALAALAAPAGGDPA